MVIVNYMHDKFSEVYDPADGVVYDTKTPFAEIVNGNEIVGIVQSGLVRSFIVNNEEAITPQEA